MTIEEGRLSPEEFEKELKAERRRQAARRATSSPSFGAIDLLTIGGFAYLGKEAVFSFVAGDWKKGTGEAVVAVALQAYNFLRPRRRS